MIEVCHSEHTPSKHAALECFYMSTFPVMHEINKRTPWTHDRLLIVDTHGGPGFYSTGMGSPVLGWVVCDRKQIPADHVAFEIDSGCAEQLRQVFAGVVHAESYEEMPRRLVQLRARFGVVNVDPRGAKDLNMLPIQQFLGDGPMERGRHCMDVIVHASETAAKRAADASVEEKVSLLEELGYKRLAFKFTRDRGNSKAWHWKMFFLTRGKDRYQQQIVRAALKSGQLALMSDNEQLSLDGEW